MSAKEIKIEDRLLYGIYTDLAKLFIVGPGNALYLQGWCYHTTQRIRRLYFLIDGSTYAVANYALARKDVFEVLYNKMDVKGNSLNIGFWVIIPFHKVDSRRDVNLDIRAVLSNGQVCESHAGSITLEPTMHKDLCDLEITTRSSARSSDEPLVAICMTTYNPPIELFKKQVTSIVQQTHKNWVCIINDDCSNPDIFKQIKDITMEDSRFIVYQNRSNLGYYYNFERCLLRTPAKASFVALADQDDYWHEDKLSVLLSYFDEDTMLVFSDMNIVDEQGEIIHDTYWTTRKNNFKELDLLILSNTVTGAASIFRRDLVDLILPFPEKIDDAYHDHFIACIALAIGKIGYVERPLYDYCQHGDNIIGHFVPSDKCIGERIKHTLKWLKEIIPLNNNFEGIKGLLWYYRAQYYKNYIRRALIANVLKLRCNHLSKKEKAIIERFVLLEKSAIGLIFQVIKDKILRKDSITMGLDSILLKSVFANRLINAYFRLNRA